MLNRDLEGVTRHNITTTTFAKLEVARIGQCQRGGGDKEEGVPFTAIHAELSLSPASPFKPPHPSVSQPIQKQKEQTKITYNLCRIRT